MSRGNYLLADTENRTMFVGYFACQAKTLFPKQLHRANGTPD